VKFFFDNNLAPKIAKGLNGFVSPDHTHPTGFLKKVLEQFV
jgi:hypothetical protein